jgi:hypothetical protein
MDPNRLPEGSDRAELLASNELSGPHRQTTEARISATERSGSITALGVLLGFSITILGDWSNRPGKWELVGAIPLFLYGSSVALQVVALYRILQLPREIQEDHRRAINLAVIGLVVMFVGFLSTIVIDVLEEAPVNRTSAIVPVPWESWDREPGLVIPMRIRGSQGLDRLRDRQQRSADRLGLHARTRLGYRSGTSDENSERMIRH